MSRPDMWVRSSHGGTSGSLASTSQAERLGSLMFWVSGCGSRRPARLDLHTTALQHLNPSVSVLRSSISDYNSFRQELSSS